MRDRIDSGMVVNVRAPLVDLNNVRSSAYTVFASFGSTRIWLKYIARPLSLLVSFHVAPRSSERQMPARFGSSAALSPARPVRPPPSPPPPGCGPGSLIAYTTFGSLRANARPTRPQFPYGGSPPPSSFFHVFPASVVFHSALPGPPPLKPHAVRRR